MNCVPIKSNLLDFRINQLIEDVFKFTINKNPETFAKKQSLTYLEEVAVTTDKSLIDLEVLEHALFERLLLENPVSQLIKYKDNDRNVDIRATLNECITYLFECSKDLQQYSNTVQNESDEWKQIINHINTLIIRNAATALKQPDLYSFQDIHAQVRLRLEGPTGL